jgi:hypothetical protein
MRGFVSPAPIDYLPKETVALVQVRKPNLHEPSLGVRIGSHQRYIWKSQAMGCLRVALVGMNGQLSPKPGLPARNGQSAPTHHEESTRQRAVVFGREPLGFL